MLSYQNTELDSKFLGFFENYNDLVNIPNDFTIIDFGCYQGVQAQYFKNHAAYIGVDYGVPISARFSQDNATYYEMTPAEFCENILPTMNIDVSKVFVVASFVLNKEITTQIKQLFPNYRIISIIDCQFYMEESNKINTEELIR